MNVGNVKITGDIVMWIISMTKLTSLYYVHKPTLHLCFFNHSHMRYNNVK